MSENKKPKSKQEKGKKNMWQEMLREANTKKEIEESNIFIFGDKFSGKKSLIKNISQRISLKDEKKINILEIDDSVSKFGLVDYTYLNIRKLQEEDSDYIGKMGVWIFSELIDGETIETLIKPEYMLKSCFVIVADLSKPVTLKESIKKWLNFIYSTFSKILLKLPYETQEKLRNNEKKRIQLYEEPKFDNEGQFIKEILSEEDINLKLETELKEGLLKTNIGIPIILSITKSDIVNKIEEKKNFEENSDFILKHLRQIAIQYGGTIIYNSIQNNINITLLYEYLCNVLFNFDLIHKPNLVDKESYFIPAGYDSLENLRLSDSSTKYIDMLYEDRITNEKSKPIQEEEEETCEDTNLFLSKLLSEKDKNHSHRDNINKRKSPNDINSNNIMNFNKKIENQKQSSDVQGGFKRFMDNKHEEKKVTISKPSSHINNITKKDNNIPSTTNTTNNNPVINHHTKETHTNEKEFKRTKEEMLKKLGILKKK